MSLEMNQWTIKHIVGSSSLISWLRLYSPLIEKMCSDLDLGPYLKRHGHTKHLKVTLHMLNWFFKDWWHTSSQVLGTQKVSAILSLTRLWQETVPSFLLVQLIPASSCKMTAVETQSSLSAILITKVSLQPDLHRNASGEKYSVSLRLIKAVVLYWSLVGLKGCSSGSQHSIDFFWFNSHFCSRMSKQSTHLTETLTQCIKPLHSLCQSSRLHALHRFVCLTSHSLQQQNPTFSFYGDISPVFQNIFRCLLWIALRESVESQINSPQILVLVIWSFL